MTPVSMRPPIMTNSPAKNARVGHSTSARTSLVSALETATSRPAPSRATMLGAKCSTGCRTNPAMTRASTIRPWTSMRGSRIASRSSRSMISAARSGSWTKAERNMTRARAMRTRTSTAASGARWTRKSLKVRPARLAMMMFGGSPTRVAVPPMLEANTSAIRNGAAGSARRSQTSRVTGAISSTVVTLSSSAEAVAVMTMSITITRNGRARAFFTDQIARYSNSAGALEHADDHHHAHEQEDDVPVDARSPPE